MDPSYAWLLQSSIFALCFHLYQEQVTATISGLSARLEKRKKTKIELILPAKGKNIQSFRQLNDQASWFWLVYLTNCIQNAANFHFCREK
jgi:hypothetical protein